VTADASSQRTLRSLGPSVYLPSFIFSVGQGAVIPIVALVAKDLGASVAVAGLVVAVRGFGTLAFDLPAGWLVSRYGERRSMTFATILLLVSLTGCVGASSVPVFAFFMFLMGCGWAVWLLARMTYVSDVMPPHLRGRALSVLGGSMRIGNFVGPFLGAVAIGRIGLDGAYYVHIVLAALGLAVLLLAPSLDESPPAAHGPISFRAVGRANVSVWRTAGVGALCIGVLRACRPVVLPLWADHIGIDAAAISVIFGISSGMDMTLFYPAGAASDRWGRKFVAVPCMGFMALGFALLPLTGSFSTLVLVGILLGFGNGLGSGIVMTLGTDFAPVIGKAEFLGVWRLIGDLGTAGGPLLAAGVSAAAGLGPASLAVSAIGVFGATLVLLRMPEPMRRTEVILPGDAGSVP
jgi:MFS family permease